jgi:stalled ribosome alternative rescue factor ArfA
MLIRRNPIAASLKSSHLRQLKIKARKGKGSYNRNEKHRYKGENNCHIFMA